MYLVAIGEIFLKGKNRVIFERRLIRNIRKTLNLEENELLKFRNRYIIKKENIEKLKRVFGIIFYVKVKESKKEGIKQTALSLINNENTFRITAKKSQTLNKSSTEINEEIGEYILEKNPGIKVKLDNAEINIKIEELRNNFYIYKEKDIVRCLGGLPIGTGGFVHINVKDDMKSTITAFLLLKKGCIISLSKDLPLINKFTDSFNLRVRQEKDTDIIAIDEDLKDIEIKRENKLILRPLIGYSEKEIKDLYSLVISL
ncbi:hypothetical protein J4216_02410 [Candidatus Woesearchaeota archaeon]|nr:hypothetical protein [Candidatus Woesearchaeota archaeon]